MSRSLRRNVRRAVSSATEPAASPVIANVKPVPNWVWLEIDDGRDMTNVKFPIVAPVRHQHELTTFDKVYHDIEPWHDLEVFYNGEWRPAQVLAPLTRRTFTVTFEHVDESHDSMVDVTLDRLKRHFGADATIVCTSTKSYKFEP